MIDFNYLITKLQMQAIVDRIAEHDAAHEISKGVWIPDDEELLPAPISEARKLAWQRAKRQVQSLGPRILTSKKQAVLGGGITWGDVDDKADEIIQSLNLPKLANGLLENLIIDGMAACMAHQDVNNDSTVGEYKISRIGGYLQPYMTPNNIDEITGIYQAWTNTSSSRTLNDLNSNRSTHRFENTRDNQISYSVRVYDFETQEIKEWLNVKNPAHLANEAHNVTDNAPTVRYAIREVIDEGLTLGELLQAVPTLKRHYALTLKQVLSEELASFPMFYTKGDVEFSGVGAAEVVTMPADGDAGWLDPTGNLEELSKLIMKTEERLRGDLSLSGGFLGNDSPSGEALKEANIKFNQNTEYYAETLSMLLTDAVKDLAELRGDFEPVEIAVIPSKAYEEKDRRDTVVTLYKEGLIPLSVAVLEMQTFFPTWADDDLNEWVKSQTATVSVDDFNALAGETQDTTEA